MVGGASRRLNQIDALDIRTWDCELLSKVQLLLALPLGRTKRISSAWASGSSVAAAASLGASPRGGQSCRSPSVGQSRKRRPSVDWPGLLFPRGMRSSHHATSHRFLRAAASRRRWHHSVTIRYTSGVLFCGRNICLGFVQRASSSRARESSAAPRCIQFPTLASLHVRRK